MVEVSADEGATWSTAMRLGVDVDACTVSGLASGRAYQFRVQAVNLAGASADSNVAGATTDIDPRVPYGLTATASSSTEVELNWQCDSPAIYEFWIELSSDGQNWLWWDYTYGTTYTLSDLLPETTLYFRVFGYDYDLWEDVGPTNVAEVTTPGIPHLGDGTGLSATYFDSDDFTGSTVERLDASVDFAWWGGSPAPGIGTDT